MASYKKLQQAREIRLWLCKLGIPLVALSVFILSDPVVLSFILSKFDKIKQYFNKFSED